MGLREHWAAKKVTEGLPPGAQLTAFNVQLAKASHAMRYALSDLDDVTVASVADDHFLVYNSTTARWENTALSAALLPSHTHAASQVTAGTFPAGAFAFTTALADASIASAATWNAKQAGHVNLTSLAALSYTALGFVKMTGAATFTLDLSTYSLSSHNHSGTYEASGAVATHAALTTGIHGLAITGGQTLTVTTGALQPI